MNSLTEPSVVPLTALAHGGGCGCKLAPSVLQQLLADQPMAGPFARLLVGPETADDAAVWQLDNDTCVIATTDFFMPMVNDPFDFGRIAAANALSDVYAMGGKPIMALSILGMPIDKLPAETIRQILKGGGAVCAEAGIPIAGGHSIDSLEPIYGLAVIGTCPIDNVRRNTGALAGDALILTKALGVGIYSAALKKSALPPDAYGELVASTTRLNSIGCDLGNDPEVHAMTDVTGFGILGHAWEMAEGSKMQIVLNKGDMALFSHCEELAQQGYVTGASHRNWASYGTNVVLPENLPVWWRHVLTDPQTSGGLLIACHPKRARALIEEVVAAGCPQARIIGTVEEGMPSLRVLG